MPGTTKQIKEWMGDFGKEYTARNTFNVTELDRLYHKKLYGIKRSELNDLFIGKLNRNIRILEIGSNVGNQLLMLQKMGFKKLYGIEINAYAVEVSKTRCKNINIIQGVAFDIPFKDEYFDLVFTSGVLIHIHPRDIKKVLREIYRCTKKYIWGLEYYSEKYEKVVYRGHKDLLWKTDFPGLYLDSFPDLRVVRKKMLRYLDNENVDVGFLLKKQKVNIRGAVGQR